MSSSPPQNPRKWRFTWETLAHIPTLRLYLFNPEINPSSRCLDLRASLRLDESLLLLTWIDGGGIVVVRVPVPRVLIDPGRPIDYRANHDHIEFKLTLVLPVDHPIVANLQRVLHPVDEGMEKADDGSLDRFLPLSLDSGLKSLSSGDVHFYCKTCSTKLTREPLRNFVEIPSVNWREAADNWFGSCCCSFGEVSEKLVSQYINTYNCAEGKCLLDAASVTICIEDLDGYVFEHCSDEHSTHGPKAGLPFTDNSIEVSECFSGNNTEGVPDVCVTESCVANKMMNLDLDLDIDHQISSLSFPLLSSAACCSNVPKGSDPFSAGSPSLALKLNGTGIAVNSDYHCHVDHEKPVSELIEEFSSNDQCHCCVDETRSRLCAATTAEKVSQTISSEQERSWNLKGLHSSSLGNGFIVRAHDFSNDVEWVAFSCRQCSSFLGSYPSLKNSTAPIDGAVRLFKCYISTYVPRGGPLDMFRKHSLQSVFVSSLLESAEEELSFRTIIKDLNSRAPMLQLVLLNSKAWLSTGYCSENTSAEALTESADLQPVAKVLFSKCTTASEADPRTIKEWSTRTHVEEVYMMTHQIEELTKQLKTAATKLPLSLSSLQDMWLSSLER